MALALVSSTAIAAGGELAARNVLERVIGTTKASQFSLTLASPLLDGVEEFTVSGEAGNIAVSATSLSALTQGAGWYLKYVTHADLVLRGRNPALPDVLPAPAEVIHQRASVPYRYALNDTNASYTDPYLTWEEWENQLDLMALHGINALHVTVGTDYVYYLLLQRYGYSDENIRRWIPDPAHQPWWLLQNLSGGEFPISRELLEARALLGRKIADRARELGMTPVLPGYWGMVPADFAERVSGADVVDQGMWYGYRRPAWLNPATPLFSRVAADYYALSDEVLGGSNMYKMDPLHEGGEIGGIDLTQAAGSIEAALQAAHPAATWVLLGWMRNPLPGLLDGIADKSRLLLLAIEADMHPAWDSGRQWNGVPYAFGSILNFGGRTIIGANATTIIERWFADLAGANKAMLRGVALFAEAWTANPAVIELMSELPWYDARFDLDRWLVDYAYGRYGANDPHAASAWSMLAATVYATSADGESEAQDSLFNAQPSLTATSALCCSYGRMRYSGVALEGAWRELLLAAPSVTQHDPYHFDLTDITRQVIVNRARTLLPLIRGAYDRSDRTQFMALTERWLALMDLADAVEGTHGAFMLGPRLDNARRSATRADEQAQLEKSAVNLITHWGTQAAFAAGLRDYANRDWNCLTLRYYKERWALFFSMLDQTLAGASPAAIDWYRLGEAFASADHLDCALTPVGDIVAMAAQVRTFLDGGPEASRVAAGWSSYSENDAIFDFDGTRHWIDSAGADLWNNVNRYGLLYRPKSFRDGDTASVRVATIDSEANRADASAGILAGSNVVSAYPRALVTIAITADQRCVLSWADNPFVGIVDRIVASAVAAPRWVRLTRDADRYVAECSADGVAWTLVGSASPSGLAGAIDVGFFASAMNGGASDRVKAGFDNWRLTVSPTSSTPLAVEYFHAGFGHYFITAHADEIAKLDAGELAGWQRTGETFPVFATAEAGAVPVCRFFSDAFASKTTHFFAPRGLGCEATMQDSSWQFEGDVFYMALPDASGACPSGSSPVYRLYNNGQGGAPNHRYTPSAAIRTQMLAMGFIAEGAGVGVAMCSPGAGAARARFAQ